MPIRRHVPPLISQSGTHLAIILQLRLPPLDHVGGDVVPGQHGPSAADSGANHLAFVLWRRLMKAREGGRHSEMVASISPKRQDIADADVSMSERRKIGGTKQSEANKRSILGG